MSSQHHIFIADDKGKSPPSIFKTEKNYLNFEILTIKILYGRRLRLVEYRPAAHTMKISYFLLLYCTEYYLAFKLKHAQAHTNFAYSYPSMQANLNLIIY